eukprot:1187661-Prymnesium_polylepis.1
MAIFEKQPKLLLQVCTHGVLRSAAVSPQSLPRQRAHIDPTSTHSTTTRATHTPRVHAHPASHCWRLCGRARPTCACGQPEAKGA